MNVNSFVLIYKRSLLSLMIKPAPCKKKKKHGHAGQIITLMPPIRWHAHTRTHADFSISNADYTIRLQRLMKKKKENLKKPRCPFDRFLVHRVSFHTAEYHLQQSPTSRDHVALARFLSCSTQLSLPLAGPSADSCNIYGCLEQTLAAGN